MKILYGAEVVDKNGKALGTVNHVVRDSWSGEIRKFTVRQEDPSKQLFVSPGVVLEATESQVTLGVAVDALGEDLEA